MVIGMTSDYGPTILNTPGLAPMVTGDQPDFQLVAFRSSWASVALPDGSFAVSWSTTPAYGGSGGIYFQRLAADGSPNGSPVLIDGSGESGLPDMLALPDGTVALSYTEYHSGYRDIEVRHIDPYNNLNLPLGGKV